MSSTAALASTTATHPLYVFLLILGFVLLLLAAFNIGHPRVALGWVGLAAWELVALLTLLGWG